MGPFFNAFVRLVLGSTVSFSVILRDCKRDPTVPFLLQKVYFMCTRDTKPNFSSVGFTRRIKYYGYIPHTAGKETMVPFYI